MKRTNLDLWIHISILLLILADLYLGIVFVNALKDSITNQPKEQLIKIYHVEETQEVSQEIIPVLSEEDIINTYIEDVCEMYTVDPALIKSIVWHESRYKPNATNGQCIGLMQISKKWHAARAEKLGVTDLYDPYGNILVGVDYINFLSQQNEDPALVLMLYNMSHDTAKQIYANGNISNYAKSVLERAESIRRGEIQ